MVLSFDELVVLDTYTPPVSEAGCDAIDFSVFVRNSVDDRPSCLDTLQRIATQCDRCIVTGNGQYLGDRKCMPVYGYMCGKFMKMFCLRHRSGSFLATLPII